MLQRVEFLDASRSRPYTRFTTRNVRRIEPHPAVFSHHHHQKELMKIVSVPTDKLKAAETALTQIERQFGKGSIMRLGAKEFAAVSAIPSGSIGVDVALGVGGIPRGRIIEIFGPESSGKTTLSLHIIAEAQ